MAGGAVWVKGATRNSQDKMVQRAKEDLARVVGIEDMPELVSKIKLVSVTPVTWPDSQLGYLQAGLKKQQGINPGFLIKLDYSGREYTYHTSFSRVVYVPVGKGMPPLPANAM
ncbi:hypothetical protein [Candidatus Chlorohelix sp.]|uniref:hypothetical protein n=1 Tax=Candidatus Chlorohelix sp. TaxID=3139201 RepID=UPI003056467F